MAILARILLVIKKLLVRLITLTMAIVSVVLTAVLLLGLFLSAGKAERRTANAVDVAIMDRYDMYMTNQISDALDGVLSVQKVYWLSDDDPVAPEPNQDCYGSVEDPGTLGWLLEDAQGLLNGQQTVFSTDVEIMEGSRVQYYLDDTIFAVTWKQVMDDGVYTVSEVKVAHPSQFRRFLAGGAYGSEIQLKTTQMAASVNAVVASAGDFYGYRRYGIVVYDGTVQRVNSALVDTCYIDERGDLLFSYAGELGDMQAARQFVKDKDIRFSVSFGPVLVDRGNPVKLSGYFLGQIEGTYARAALCQMDELHYLVVTAGKEGKYGSVPKDLFAFQKRIAEFGCEKAYALDGGQTATIVMNDKLINRVVYDSERDISDIIYFATAMPDGE